jgi:hypothetical protein
MFGRIRVSLWLLAAALPAVMALAAGTTVVLTTPAQAQFWNDQRYPFLQQRQHQRQQRQGGFFQNWFGGGAPEYERAPRERETQRHEPVVDSGHAPPPHKSEAKDASPPSTSIVVMGDGMADWLAYGLEDAFADAPDVGIVRKNKVNSGLLRYDAKGDLDWWHVAKDVLAQEKASYVVMMLGVSDRQNIRERDLAKEAEKEAKEQDEKKAAEAAANPNQQGKPDEKADPQKAETADDKKAKKTTTGTVEFRTDQWEKIYTKRIDETITALKSKGVPVFWVGLPSIRGTRSTADASYLNDLFRARAERAGIVYIDVWDGFVDESGKYSSYGPDYEGQHRRLRSGDGVYFTKYGARKLAHYVEREIRRYMSNRTVALPVAPATPSPGSGEPAERPLAGPVVPLTVISSTSDELLGGGSAARVHGDALAAQVLVKGAALSPAQGRADDFTWPLGAPKPVAALTPPKGPAAATAKADTAAAASGQPPAATALPAGAAPAKPEEPAKTQAALEPKPAAAKPAQQKPVTVKTKQADAARPKPVRHHPVQRPPRPIPQHQQQPNNNLFNGIFGGAFR